jgi:phage minor structural protein
VVGLVEKLVTEIYILNRKKKIIDVLSNNGTNPSSPFFDDLFTMYLSTGADTFEFSTIFNERTSNIENGYFVLFYFKNNFKLFQIMSSKNEHTNGILIKSCYCETVGLELINKPVRKSTINGDVSTFFSLALQDSSFELGYVDPTITDFKTVVIEKPTPIYTVIQDNLSTYDIEIEFTVEIKNNKVSKQYVNVYRKRGKNTHVRFEYSTNVDNVKKSEDLTDFCSALIGVGSNGIDFKDIEWIKSNGNPTDKPMNQDFVVDETAHQYFHNDDGSYITGVYESNADNSADLLDETWKELQTRKQPKIDYETSIVLFDEDIDIGDTVYVIDHEYTPDLYLEARVSKLELSFTDWYNKSKCTLANYKEVKSKILNLSNPDDIFNEILDFLGGIGIGKLTDEDLAKIEDYLYKMGLEKKEIDELFNKIYDIIDPPPKPPTGDDTEYEPIYLSTYKNGVWVGDDRFYDIKYSETVSSVDTDNDQYSQALALYQQYNIGKNQNSSYLDNVMSSSNNYKLYVMVNYYSEKFGLDPQFVYAIMMGESSGNPSAHGQSAGSGYGLFGIERSVFFKGFKGTSTLTIKYLDGSTESFYPSTSNMTPGYGGTTAINGITVDKNISNQIKLGCYLIRQAIEYCHGNMFAALVSYNMGIGSLYWIISKYVCDTYNYTFVDSYSLSKQSNAVQAKVYEELDSLKFNFAAYRQVLKDTKGLGTPTNVEGYLKWYKIIDGQLPYYKDKNGNKLGYGVGKSTPKSSAQLNATDTRNKIVETAKAIVSQHVNQKIATYDQAYRTWNFKKPNRRSGYYYGIKNPICYDCSSFVSCCYGEAGLTSVFHADSTCSGGTLVKYATAKPGYKMWKVTTAGLNEAKPGDIVMDANFAVTSSNLTASYMSLWGKTHHTMIYIGDGKVAHASQWAYHPNAIKISSITYYINKGTSFFLRPYDLTEADNRTATETPSVEETDFNEVYIKALRLANAYNFYDSNNNLLTKVKGFYSDDNKAYPDVTPYVLIHFGINDLSQNGIDGIKTLASILRNKYRNTPIFILKELHVGTAYANYETVNTSIDELNTQLKNFCDNEDNIFLLDISSSVETYTGVLNSEYTTDGYRFKDNASKKVFYDAITSKLLSTAIGYKEKDKTDDSGESSDKEDKDNTTVAETVSIVMQANKKYEYGVVKDLTFLLPTVVVDSFYSRIIFKTPKDSEPMKYYQSKIVYLQGTDCLNGQLIPKADTTYNIIVMPNANKDLTSEKYYGSVTGVSSGGNYKEFTTFVGGIKVAEIAQTYLNQTGLRYGEFTFTINLEPTNFPNNMSGNLNKWYDSSVNKANIDGSSLVMLAYLGITYKNSAYNNHSLKKLVKNTNYSWTFKFPRIASEQARYCIQKGWVLNEADLTNFTNLKAGDLLFYDSDTFDNERFMNISHVAICVGEVDGVMSLIEATICENGVRVKSVESTTSDKLLFVARPRILS